MRHVFICGSIKDLPFGFKKKTRYHKRSEKRGPVSIEHRRITADAAAVGSIPMGLPVFVGSIPTSKASNDCVRGLLLMIVGSNPTGCGVRRYSPDFLSLLFAFFCFCFYATGACLLVLTFRQCLFSFYMDLLQFFLLFQAMFTGLG